MKWTDRGGDRTKHVKLPCPGPCVHEHPISVSVADGMIFHHRLRSEEAGEHPYRWCPRSGTHIETGERLQPLFGWFPHREGSGCEVTHRLGSVLRPDPRKTAWTAGRFGTYASPFYRAAAQDHHIRIPRGRLDYQAMPGVPDEDTWLRLLIPQLHEITGSVTAAYRCARDMAVYLGPARDSWTDENNRKLLEAVFGEVHDDTQQ